MAPHNPAPTISIDDLEMIDVRIGTVIKAETFPKAKRPAYKLMIDFGDEIGIRRSSAQITDLYTPEGHVGQQVIAAVNLPPRQITDFMSEVLTLGLKTDRGVVLLGPKEEACNGQGIC